MPFTFSHPAIVLPLNKIFKNYFSLTGLILGSLTPDFEYFLRMKIQSNYSHTVIGNLWFNLPLGIILCFIFHNIIKISLIENLPLLIQKRLGILKNSRWTDYFKNKWITVCLSLIIGGYTHIFWDSFTHNNAYFVNLFNLDREIFEGIPIYKILQHLSTLIGGLIILIYFLKLKTDNISTHQPKISYWIKIVLLTLVLLIIRFIFGLKITEYGNVIASGITSMMISLTIISLLENKKLQATKGLRNSEKSA